MVTAHTVVEALRARFQPPEWAFFTEFSDGTGGQKSRQIDVLAVNLWPSRARVVAIEVKVSRADFARELAQPNKRRPWEWAECWFAVGPGVAKPDEVPAGWGLLQLQSNGTLRTLVHAQQRELPRELPVPIWLAMARRTADPPPVLPAGSWSLPSGAIVRAPDLRRLAAKLNDREHQLRRKRSAGEEGLRTYAQERMARLGAIVAHIERELRTRVRTPDELRAALSAYATRHLGPRTAEAVPVADELRKLADRLDPPNVTRGL